jgi:UDP-N-acetylmuramoyl-L-alanyl-D-glutamate--2,6-diaminopimelate ligase
VGVGEPPARAQDPMGPLQSTGLTTPDAVTLQATLRRFVDLGLGACAIEASSIGIVDHRLNGTRVAVAMFTNLTRDHLDYGSMQGCRQATVRWPELRAAVINVDDERGAELAQELRHRRS